MFNKTYILGVLSLLSTSPCFSGFYLGAGVGPEGLHFNQNAHAKLIGTFDVIDRNSFSGIGVFGTLFGGYGLTIYDNFYVAIEGNGNLSSVEYKLTNKEYIHHTLSKTTFTVKNSEGVSLLPGYFLSENTLVYGRIAYANGRVKIHESDPTIKSATKNSNGLRYGIGIRHNWTDRWTVMMDYSQINYQNIHSFVFEPFGRVSKKTTITPNTAQIAFGIIYNFDVPKKVFVK
ncbi:MAG: outer membrane beta-barrel protein [Legionella sp.]|uniref:outer membrane protein n=1 Tax=Legionella sp. TaxID=459 RepID=UPI0039E500FA